MRIDLTRVQDLDADHARAWERIRGEDRALASPFFSLEFAQVASRLRQSEVAVIEVDNRVAGFWTFERRRMGLAVPLAFPASDHHGPIVPPQLELPASRLLQACRRQLFWFGGIPAGQRLFRHFHRTTEQSPIVRVDRLELSDQRRKLRRLEREVGPVRFEAHCADPKLLARLIEWKSAHAARTVAAHPFADAWGRALVSELHQTQTPGLRGRLSVLWAGEQPMAAHFGLVSRRAWHWWFPSYDQAFARHSPGLLMLHEMLRAAQSEGIEWIDFGPGPEAFKHRLANDALPVAFGTAFTPLAGMAIGMKRRIESGLRQTPWHGAIRRTVDWLGA